MSDKRTKALSFGTTNIQVTVTPLMEVEASAAVLQPMLKDMPRGDRLDCLDYIGAFESQDSLDTMTCPRCSCINFTMLAKTHDATQRRHILFIEGYVWDIRFVYIHLKRFF